MPKQSQETAGMHSNMKAGADQAERESKERVYDEAAAAQLFQTLKSDVAKKKAAEVAEKEALAKVVVADADVTFVSEHLDLPVPEAKKLLQQHKGDRNAAVYAFLNITPKK